jgi:Ca2+-binding RTX toxin-like protein
MATVTNINGVITGTSGNDVLTGTASTTTIYGESGNDTITGGSGNEVIYGDGGPAAAPKMVTVNLIVNGGFDTGQDGGPTIGETDQINHGSWSTFLSIDGWTATVGRIEIQTGSQGGGPVVASTNNVTELDSGDTPNSNSTIQQTVNVPQAGEWTLQFDYSGRAHTGVNTAATSEFNVLVDGHVVQSFAPSQVGFVTDDMQLSLTAGSHTIAFQGTGIQDTYGALIDNVSLTGQVPAPVTPSTSPDNDTIYAGSGETTVYGGKGNDVIYGGTGDDVLHGNSGNDTIYAGSGNTVLYGDSGNNILYAGSGHDTLYGGSGTNVFNNLASNDILAQAGSGNATFNYAYSHTAGNLTVTGGAGTDVLNISMPSASTPWTMQITLGTSGSTYLDVSSAGGTPVEHGDTTAFSGFNATTNALNLVANHHAGTVTMVSAGVTEIIHFTALDQIQIH